MITAKPTVEEMHKAFTDSLESLPVRSCLTQTGQA